MDSFMSLFKRTLLGLAVALLPVSAGSQQPAPPPERSNIAATPALTAADLDVWLDGYLPTALKTNKVAGAVVVVVKDGKILFKKGYGYDDVKRKRAVDPDRTLFRPGSITKLYTATAVMQLVEQGKIDLDADINRYLDFKIAGKGGKAITMRHLLSHTAGFEDAGYRLIVLKPDQMTSLEKAVKIWVPTRIFAPGTTPAYSNYGSALAGYIVQRVSGLPYETYIERNILSPLGMTRTSIRQPATKLLADDVSKGYTSAEGEAEPLEFISKAPAGALAITATDMAQFMIAHLQDGQLGNKRILSAATAELMHNSSTSTLTRLNKMQLGFGEKIINGRRSIGHAGGTNFFFSDLRLLPKEQVGVFISVNSLGENGSGLPLQLFEDIMNRYFPGPTPDGKVASALAKQHAQMMAGRYYLTARSDTSFMAILNLLGQIKVEAFDDGTIGAQAGPLYKKYREIAPFLWREVGGTELLETKAGPKGVERFSVNLISTGIVLTPVPTSVSGAWLIPCLFASVGIALLTGLFWPAAALVRKAYGVPFKLAGAAKRDYRLVSIAALSSLAIMGGWMMMLGGGEIAQIRILQFLTAIVFIGGFVAAILNAKSIWRAADRGHLARFWSLLLVAAFALLSYVGVTFNLISFNAYY
jgi:CubicO group peptidase (beta-lactamase class C family)